tara:strand:+ start:1987 stop:2511 length:525 start_codon:yes stop_codon:yes gene_type:complete
MKKIYFLIGFLSCSLYTQEIRSINSDLSYIKYEGNHFLHSWDATNSNISGIIEVTDNEISNIGVLAKVTDFKSGNSNLDSNSFRVLEALKIPNIVFKSSEIVNSSNIITVSGVISFHGIEKELSVQLNKKFDSNTISLTGKFLIYLSDFNIKRPSLLLQKINDEIEIELELVFN